MCCPLVFEFSVGIGGFVIGLGQISFFFSSNSYKLRMRHNNVRKLHCATVLHCIRPFFPTSCGLDSDDSFAKINFNIHL